MCMWGWVAQVLRVQRCECVETRSGVLPSQIHRSVAGMQSREMAANAVNSAAAQYRLDGMFPYSYRIPCSITCQIACCGAGGYGK
jgi:hypothetical protein